MSRPIIEAEKLSKKYRLGVVGMTTLREEVARLKSRLAGRSVETEPDEFWALRNVSFSIQPGEVVGVIGRNGAGKSTLLKILSRITEPTSGRAVLRGRVASLLEVGTGFHPDLTGHENVFLNGAILGMKRPEIIARFDEIVAFAEVEKFIDTPVKHYSSGMRVRLAFAVAAHLASEILIVDEVLAVGDAEFQKKCLGKMDDVAQREHRTVLFVSHNMEAVSALTRRSILMAGGQVAGDGPTSNIIAQHLRGGETQELMYSGTASDSVPGVTRVQLHASAPGNIQFHGEPMRIEIRIETPWPIDGARLEICACDEHGHRVLQVWLHDGKIGPMLREPGRHEVICQIPKVRLYPGKYTLMLHLAERSGGRMFQRLDGICPFEVFMPTLRDGGWQPHDGTYLEDAHWEVRPITASAVSDQ